ncbi:ankyrin repeat domain protein [Candidatus Rickettsiella viridis]|uniref:Ankyrin repeat domain protein n=1 Tax=Candidatus Rickettsiella viridis TaxID=676208 RepID=A0A2Z5V4C3_9COXI|nr:ankyrin repeat domain-containing protein [Candidatus Rickettsiella viridis]BBB15292.1 ankyrin repeat domain protein [Candidatus Rickettsiella viridis]
MLLDAGADAVVDTLSERGDAVIHNVLENDTEDNDLLKRLIEVGANINIPDKKGCTLLHLNVLYYKSEIANKMLLVHGADYLIEDENGMTALQYAAKTGFYPLIDELIKVKLSKRSAASIDEIVKIFKIILLENPRLLKPKALLQSVSSLEDYLANEWDSLQQELQLIKDEKIGDSKYSLYDALICYKIFSNTKVLASINDDTLKRFPNFLNEIKTLKKHMRKREASPLGMASKKFKLSTAESLSDRSLSSTSEESQDKTFKPA